ncbi:MAG: hypothetical protein ACYTG6_03755 [Planctomycetota bacterium]|jgi:hypothetical protein
MDWNQLLEETKRAFWRLFRSDFQRVKATDDERKALAEAERPIENPMAQDYAAWRHSLLWVAGISLAFLTILEFATFESQEDQIRDLSVAAAREAGNRGYDDQAVEQQIRDTVEAFGRDNLTTLDGLNIFLILPVLVGAVMAVLAALRWTDVRRSRRFARLAFLINFLTPFAVAVIPVTEMLNFGHLQPQQRKMVIGLVGVNMGLSFFMLIGPRAIALFPAVIRSSMTLKTMLPESPMPGWAAALMAPLYSIFLLVVFTTVNQMYGNLWLLAGIACLMIGPLVYVWRGRDVLRPHTAEEVTKTVGAIRRISSNFTLAGAVLLGIFFLDLEFMDFGDYLKFFISLVGQFVLLTVVGSDFLLALLKAGHAQARALQESELEAPLEQRFEALSESGLTELRTMRQGEKSE